MHPHLLLLKRSSMMCGLPERRSWARSCCAKGWDRGRQLDIRGDLTCGRSRPFDGRSACARKPRFLDPEIFWFAVKRCQSILREYCLALSYQIIRFGNVCHFKNRPSLYSILFIFSFSNQHYYFTTSKCEKLAINYYYMAYSVLPIGSWLLTKFILWSSSFYIVSEKPVGLWCSSA